MATIAHCVPFTMKMVHLQIDCHRSVARFESHIASVVGGKSAGNGTHHMHMLKRATNESLAWDPPHDSTTDLAHKSVEESSHVSATITTFRNGVIMNIFYMLPGLA